MILIWWVESVLLSAAMYFVLFSSVLNVLYSLFCVCMYRLEMLKLGVIMLDGVLIVTLLLDATLVLVFGGY